MDFCSSRLKLQCVAVIHLDSSDADAENFHLETIELNEHYYGFISFHRCWPKACSPGSCSRCLLVGDVCHLVAAAGAENGSPMDSCIGLLALLSVYLLPRLTKHRYNSNKSPSFPSIGPLKAFL